MKIVDPEGIQKRRATAAERAEVCEYFRDPEGASKGKPSSYPACVAMAACIEEGLVSVHMVILPGGTEEDESPMMQRLKNETEFAEEMRLRAEEHEVH